MPRSKAVRVTARTAAFMPGASPPLVNTPRRFMCSVGIVSVNCSFFYTRCSRWEYITCHARDDPSCTLRFHTKVRVAQILRYHPLGMKERAIESNGGTSDSGECFRLS